MLIPSEGHALLDTCSMKTTSFIRFSFSFIAVFDGCQQSNIVEKISLSLARWHRPVDHARMRAVNFRHEPFVCAVRNPIAWNI